MIYAVVPFGARDGWGIFSRNLIQQLAPHEQLWHVYNPLERDNCETPLDYHYFSRYIIPVPQLLKFGTVPEGTVLQVIDEYSNIWGPLSASTERIGLSFNLHLHSEKIEEIRNHFRVVVAGSNFCASVFAAHGIPAISIPQGIDPVLFNPSFSKKQIFADKFVVFAGGKFEFRKGQDAFIKAYAQFQKRHKDSVLVLGWHNSWKFAFNTMERSTMLKFSPIDQFYSETLPEAIGRILNDNGVTLDNVIILPAVPHSMWGAIYRNTDVGVFPSRCEGGTNLVMMEYMACGKPVIASYHTGHLDILTPDNCLPLRDFKTLPPRQDDNPMLTAWKEMNSEEILEQLEWAYQNRSTLPEIGARGASKVAAFTWEHMGREILDLIHKVRSGAPLT